jgi:hypothetical protein
MHFDFSPIQDFMYVKAAFDAVLSDHADLISDHARLRELAYRALAWNAFWSASKAFDLGDLASSRELLSQSRCLYPEIRHRSEYRRLCWKRWMGRYGWSMLRPIVNYARGRARAPARVT